MRLEIHCQDRLGIAKEVLNILVEHGIDLKGIEVDPQAQRMYVAFPEIEFEQFRLLMPAIRKIPGVDDVVKTPFMPSEREHNELSTLLRTLPDGVLSIDTRGNILVANAAACLELQTDIQALTEMSVSQLFSGFDLLAWMEQEEVLPQTTRLDTREQQFIADILPIHVPDADGQNILAGAVINLKSETRLGQQVVAFRQQNLKSFSHICAHSTSMRRVVREAKKMAQLDGPILVVGETGTGKEVIAKACHAASHRSEKPFLALSCASLPDNVAESELFGYGPNAYEGSAPEGKKGVFEQADGGTVFLDEVGEMSPELQTKLLRFLQDGSFRRVAEEKEVHVDVRVICATQKDLPTMVQEHTFREDLFYRLNVLTLHIAPLRERKNDIIPLAKQFTQRFSLQMGRNVPAMSKVCIEFMEHYPWPGNVRQLENALYRAVTLLEGDTLEKAHLELPSYTSDFGYLEEEFDGTLEEAVKQFESDLLRKLYPAYPSSRQLAKKLGLSHTAIANKLREYGINKKTVKV
ncbi:transcriptional regulator TyrR [Algicola sagamiensis]|uniref:transcriptional regulator TyrR n=1 Tax=Algicola sagamiensis TaxID=163869 RepID=UPI00035C74C7|nr:transcriptional regulator TyrR [Algicola sagamiensis]